MNVNVNVSFNSILSVLMLPMVLSQYAHNGNEIQDLQPSDTDRVCSGYHSGNILSLSGSVQHWYYGMERHYNGCTYVDDNLILTWFTDSNIRYDFNFLRSIRYVRGYVLIALPSPATELPLVNLEIIRANKTLSFLGVHQAGLAILLTNFTTIRLPKLIEISHGSVVSRKNAEYQHIEIRRSWDDIMRGRVTSNPASLQIPRGNEIANPSDVCPASCPHRCYRYQLGEYRCCDSQCAGGCWGSSSSQCERCRDFLQSENCVSHCSAAYFRQGGRCVRNPWSNVA